MSNVSEGSAPPESDAELIVRLMRFYSVDSLDQLVRAQNKHIENLQIYGVPRLGREGCLMRWLRTIFCRHEWQQRAWLGTESGHVCTKCGRIRWQKHSVR